MIGICTISFGYSNLFNKSKLFVLDHIILRFNLVQLSDQQVNILPILSNFIKAIRLKLLLFKLNVFILLLEVPKLVLKGCEVSLTAFELVHLRSQFWDKEVLVLRNWSRQHHWFWWWQRVSWNILRMSHLIHHESALGGRTQMNWWSWSTSDWVRILLFKCLGSKAALGIRIIEWGSVIRWCMVHVPIFSWFSS